VALTVQPNFGNVREVFPGAACPDLIRGMKQELQKLQAQRSAGVIQSRGTDIQFMIV
jgi:hypothetical protein